ncbi:MAG: pilus assembly PilX N-terminal domain-containing protein [Blastocatellia bacterium]
MQNNQRAQRDSERGMALVTALLATTMMLALGMALVFSAATDTTTTRVQRVGQQAFFAADAGVGVARRAMTQAFSEQINKVRTEQIAFYKKVLPAPAGQFPDAQAVPPADGTWTNSFYTAIRDRAIVLATLQARAQKLDAANGSKFTVTYSPFSGTITKQVVDQFNAIEYVTLRYSIAVTGQTTGGGSATVHESGLLSTELTLAASGEGARNFKFSGFGAFFDNGDTQASAPLANGTFSGPVHTNTHFAFLSNRSVTFRNLVSQFDAKIRYDDTNTTTPNTKIPPPNLPGITLSSDGYKTTTSKVPLPENNFSQEYAVINGTGITDKKTDGTPVDAPGSVPTDGQGHPIAVFDSSGRVTTDVLVANLRNAKNQAPSKSGSDLADGVYISADGTNINGAGIYVEGDASDIQVYAETNGNQVYVVQQGSKTTTVTTNYTTQKTTITSGSDTKTYNGVFTDKSDPANPGKVGVSLFVDGSINSLRGGHTSSTDKAAIAPKTKLTITAQSDITVTGDLTYANKVVDDNGNKVSNIDSIENVFGLFTNDGNLNLAPNSSYVDGPGLGLEIDAAVITFNSNTSNDGGAIKGSIVYTGGTTPGTNDRWKLIGSRVQSKINTIGYNYRDIFFDPRYSGGTFSPPFFPGTTYELIKPVAHDVDITLVDTPFPTAMSWFRDNN